MARQLGLIELQVHCGKFIPTGKEVGVDACGLAEIGNSLGPSAPELVKMA